MRSFLRPVPVTALVVALATPFVAHAHAVLVSSSPAANQVVHGGSLQISLRYNSRVDAERSTLMVADEHGATRSLQTSQGAQDEIVSEADGLSKGTYQLRWQALSSDGHITRGQIPFQVQ